MKLSINGHIIDTNTMTHKYQGLNIWNGREFLTINSINKVFQTLYRTRDGRYFLIDYPRCLEIPPSGQEISPQTAVTWLELNDHNIFNRWPWDLILIATSEEMKCS